MPRRSNLLIIFHSALTKSILPIRNGFWLYSQLISLIFTFLGKTTWHQLEFLSLQQSHLSTSLQIFLRVCRIVESEQKLRDWPWLPRERWRARLRGSRPCRRSSRRKASNSIINSRPASKRRWIVLNSPRMVGTQAAHLHRLSSSNICSRLLSPLDKFQSKSRTLKLIVGVILRWDKQILHLTCHKIPRGTKIAIGATTHSPSHPTETATRARLVKASSPVSTWASSSNESWWSDLC